MGYGNYSAEAHQAMVAGRTAKPLSAVFAETTCHPKLDPRGVKLRESRDSATHPDSLGIVLALDVSGSMEDIPHALATKTLPQFMEAALTVVPDPQVLFMAIGNAFADRSPLQVGQFESEAALMDRWLSLLHIEAGGGGLCESYDLAMYFAARHTAMDCLEKRGKKGYFFLTGDEPPFFQLESAQVEHVIGEPIPAPIPIWELTAELLTKFHVFVLIPDAARAAREQTGAIWRVLLHERAIVMEASEDTAVVCALLIGITEGKLTNESALRALLSERFSRTGEAADRVIRVVRSYTEALAKGPIAAPGQLHRRTTPSPLAG